MASILSRVAGSLAGQAVGDALGAPAEGLSAYDVTRGFQKLDDYFGKTGKFSNATRLGLTILSVLVSKGTSGESIDRAHESFLKNDPRDGWLSGLKTEAPMTERGSRDSVDPWIAAKLCPLGALAAATNMDDVRLLSLCKRVALPTHAFRPAILASWVAAKIVKEVSRNHEAYSRSSDLYDKEGSLLCQAIEFCRSVEDKMGPEENSAGSMSERLCYARARLQSRCGMAEFAALNGHSRDVFEVVSFSTFCFMNRPEEFGSVVEAVGLGGSAMARGAVLGAMTGAFAGIREIPPSLVRDVEGSNRILSMAKEMTDAIQPQEG